VPFFWQRTNYTAGGGEPENLPFPIRGLTAITARNLSTPSCSGTAKALDLKLTRSRWGNKNDGAPLEQKNWTAVRQLVGHLRYDTKAELLLLNKIWRYRA
jgi:hypothetical protein